MHSTDLEITRAGIGLRFAHYDAVCETLPDVGFLEVHTENFFGGGYHLDVLSELAQHYALSLHCVSLSLGSAEPVDATHLAQVKALNDRFQPALLSDHASWSRSGNAHLPDLLPLPYNNETLQALCDNINRVQDALGCNIAVENPSTYLQWHGSTMDEAVFLAQASEQTGCRLLLDLNNIIVQAHNHGLNPDAYLNRFEADMIAEIHLAGHTEEEHDDHIIKIDTHSQPVPDSVWSLYARALKRFNAVPTLIEWDKDMPALDVLLEEATKANLLLAEYGQTTEPSYAMG